MVILVFYILVSVELIAEEIEDPFGMDENDLPLDGLCETIQGNAEEILGSALPRISSALPWMVSHSPSNGKSFSSIPNGSSISSAMSSTLTRI